MSENGGSPAGEVVAAASGTGNEEQPTTSRQDGGRVLLRKSCDLCVRLKRACDG
ncbi:unnamed protein product, partial [Ectocarpus sp. 12 AP-2014]